MTILDHITQQPPGRSLVRGKGPGLILPFSRWALMQEVGKLWLVGIIALFFAFIVDLPWVNLHLVPAVLFLSLISLLYWGWSYVYLRGAHLRLIVEPDGCWSVYVHPENREALIDGTLTLLVIAETPNYQQQKKVRTTLHKRRYEMVDHLPADRTDRTLHATLLTPTTRLTRPLEIANRSIYWKLTYTHRPYRLLAIRAAWILPAEIAYL